MNVPPIQRLLIPPCVRGVLRTIYGKVMIPGKILLGAHIQIGMTDIIQHAFDALYAGDADGAGREPLVFVRVVGRIYFQVLEENAVDGGIVQGELDGRIGLQPHSFFQSVEV